MLYFGPGSFFSVEGHKYFVLMWKCVSAPSVPLMCYIVFGDQNSPTVSCCVYHLCSWLATPQTSWVDFLCCGWWQEAEDDPENRTEENTPYLDVNEMIDCTHLLIITLRRQIDNLK